MLTFDEEQHRYTLDGVALPSVTQVIESAGLYDFSGVSPAILEAARQYGKAVHKMVELWFKNDLDVDALDKNLHGPLRALSVWWLENNMAFSPGAQVEVMGYHPKLKYAGTPDIKFPDLLIDIKPNIDNRLTTSLQTIAYDKMDNGDREHRILVLNQDGTYLYQRINETKARRNEMWRRFRKLLDMYHDKENVKKWRY